MCCTDEERARYNEQLLTLMPTHVAKSYAYNEKTKVCQAKGNVMGRLDW